MDPSTIYPTRYSGQPLTPAPQQLKSWSNKRHKILIATVTGISLVLIVSSAAAINHYSNSNAPKASLPVYTQKTSSEPKIAKTDQSSQPSTSTTKPVSGPAISKTPVKITQPSQPIQQLPQQPAQGSNPPSSGGSAPPNNTIPVNSTTYFNFYYVGGSQHTTASGASVSLTQYQPSVPEEPGAENHSLMELAAESQDGQQIVEVGWVVDKTMNGDDLPHLFTYHWVSGQTSCYNGCGFVHVSSNVVPGQAVLIGASGNYSINYSSNNWNISYNGINIGYFPASLWGGAFTHLGLVQVFGEVAISKSSTTQCIQMGNGLAGSNNSSARISNFSLIGGSAAPSLWPYQPASSPYSYGSASAVGMNIGGPGIC